MISKAPTPNEMRVRKAYKAAEERLWSMQNPVDFFGALYTLMQTPRNRVYAPTKFDQSTGKAIEYAWKVDRRQRRSVFYFSPDLQRHIKEKFPEVQEFLDTEVAHRCYVLAFENATLVLNYEDVEDPRDNLPASMGTHKELVVRIAGLSRYTSTLKETLE